MTCRCAMTSRSCRVNTWASILLVLVVTDVVLVGRSIGVGLRRRRTSPLASSPHQADDLVSEPADDDESPSLEVGVPRTRGLQHIAGGTLQRQRRSRVSASERVVVPQYMWRLYRRQQRANRERQHRRPAAASDDFKQRPYAGNTIRSFVATSYSDSFTGE